MIGLLAAFAWGVLCGVLIEDKKVSLISAAVGGALIGGTINALL